MNPERARQILLGHAFGLDDLSAPLMNDGFLLSFRHFKGLKREKCAQIEACLHALAPELGRDFIDREVVSALWSILWTTRNWALHPEGLLRRNNLIDDEDVAWLQQWVDKLAEEAMILLDLVNPGAAHQNPSAD